ncbi:MAG: hypothetical protein KF683_15450 [Rubrivivax sp.]|nr:hypothetical protein [Rubrivivax sp.]
MHKLRINVLSAVAVAVLASVSTQATASFINFDDQGLVGPSTFADASPSPQTIDITQGAVTATFTGGVILTQTTNLPANQTSIYGTASFGTGLSNPLTISFSQPVTNLILDVLNGDTVVADFEVSDGVDTQIFSLAPNLSSGAATIGLLSTASNYTIRQTRGTANFWDFFIDNIRYNVNADCDRTGCFTVPAPGSLALVLAGLGAFALVRPVQRLRSRNT